jgi:dTDP-4-amino-4,6-dideoxygalactose transaminase/acetyltransferase-like isoleucine patch superfamily enzyme
VIEPAFVHPTAVIDEGAEIGAGARIWHFVHVSAGARIGEAASLGQNTFVGRGVRVGARSKVQNNVSIYEGVEIEDDVFLGPSCVFTNVSHPRAFLPRMSELAPTRVGRGATIGANATIVCGHTVGEFALVGAGAVVTRDVPPHALVVGSPARRIGWVSRAGRRLAEGPDPTCPETGERYAVDGAGCRPVAAASDPSASAALASPPAEIPFVDLRELHAPIEGELRAAFERVLTSGRFILGEEVASFERDVAASLGVTHAIAVSSGSDALLAALMALGVGPGDEVVTTPFSFFATVGAIVRLGARPVFADVTEEALLLDPAAVARVATPRTRVVLPVHLFGAVCDVAALRAATAAGARGAAPVIEDAAQAFGATRDGRAAGGLGKLGCFSFFPTKVLGALGDGGLVTSDDPGLAEKVRRLRVHGASAPHHHQLVGGNFRMDALQAALLRVKLPHAAAWREQRRSVARAYRDALTSAGVLHLPGVRLLAADDAGHAASQIALRVPAARRDRVRAALAAAGVGTEVYYPVPLHLQPSLENLGHRPGDFPVAEAAAAELLCLPLRPGLTRGDVERVVGLLAGELLGKGPSE